MGMIDKLTDKAISDEIAGGGDEDEEAAITLVRIKSFSVANEASKDVTSTPQAGSSTPLTGQEGGGAEGGGEAEEKESSATGITPADTTADTKTTVNDRIRKTDAARPSRFSVQQEPFSKHREPRKSVLKKTPHVIARASSTYDSTTNSPPSSPMSINSGSSMGSTGTRSPTTTQDDRKCCVVM